MGVHRWRFIIAAIVTYILNDEKKTQKLSKMHSPRHHGAHDDALQHGSIAIR